MSHFLNINKTPGPITPEGVVLIDPASGTPYQAGAVFDSTGAAFRASACAHAYAYNASGQLVTDTATSGASTWVKTYSYTGAKLSGETVWVKQ